MTTIFGGVHIKRHHGVKRDNLSAKADHYYITLPYLTLPYLSSNNVYLIFLLWIPKSARVRHFETLRPSRAEPQTLLK